MNLDGIEVFVKVAQAGSFSQAARILGMPNSTVSAKVSQLEKRLGVTLLQRTTRKLNLTQAGERYFRRCAQALDDLQAAEGELATAQSEPQGLLRLTAPVEIAHSVLPAVIRSYLQKHAQVTVDLIVTNRVLDLVTEGVDLAIRAGRLRDSGLIARRFSLGHFALWASPAYVKSHPAPHPKDLSQHNFLHFSLFKNRYLELTNGRENVKIAVSGRLLADDFEVLKSLAALGEGIAFLPGLLCSEEKKRHQLINILPSWHGESVSFSLVYPAQRFVSPKIRAFINVTEEMLKNRNV
ncbi:MAG: LysR family transcriptional regulator [Alphaproteobacteria bacterium]